MVTTFAEIEKGMGNKKPVRYTVYSALTLVMAALGLVCLFVMPLLFENGTIFSNMSDDIFLLCWISGAGVCVALAVFFLISALKVGIMAPYENIKWSFELHTELVDISVRQNNKKGKYWYDRDQLEQIESLVKSASENAELKLETRRKKLVSFSVIDTENNCIRFKGLFI